MSAISSETLHVLLVEQDRDIVDLFTSLIEASGHSVATAHSAGDALWAASGTTPDVVFSSLVFHDMNGFDLCARLRATPELSDTCIVALTGYSAEGIEADVLAAGFARYLLKPVELRVMLDLLAELAADKAVRRRAGHLPPHLPLPSAPPRLWQ